MQSPGLTAQLRSVTTGYVLVLRRGSNTFTTGGFKVHIYAAPIRTDLSISDPTIWEKVD